VTRNVVADVFTQRNFVANFMREKCNFCLDGKRQFCVFVPSVWEDLGETYAVRLKLIEKRAGPTGLPIVNMNLILEVLRLGSY